MVCIFFRTVINAIIYKFMGSNQIQIEHSANTTIFWVVTPYNSVWIHRRFGRTYRPYIQGRKVSQARSKQETCVNLQFFFPLAHFSTPKVETIRFSETSTNFCRTTRCYNPLDHTLHSDRCQNLKFDRTPSFEITKYCIRTGQECRWLTLAILPVDWWRSLVTLDRL
jgi:hypothetical protein